MQRKRILFVAPNESVLGTINTMMPSSEHNMLALSGLDRPAEEILAYARVSSIDVIISRGGNAKSLRQFQENDLDAIPVITVQVTAFDLIEAIQQARRQYKKVAFVASGALLENLPHIIDLFGDIDVRLVHHSSPGDSYESIFKALENDAEIIIGDALATKLCRENAIPTVFLNSSERSIRHAYTMALDIIAIRDAMGKKQREFIAMMDHVPLGILGISRNEDILFMNSTAAELLDLPRETGKGAHTNLAELGHSIPEDFCQEAFASHSFNAGQRQRVHATWRRLDAQQFTAAGVITLRLEKESPPPAAAHSARQGRAFSEIIGKSPAICRTTATAGKYARTDAVVWLRGETGVGKELFAQAIHQASSRAGEPFVPINIAALPATLIESELFGYVRGAFTNARRSGKQGVFEFAGNGTVFLDEIGEMPLDLQSRLLRVLQDGSFMRLGDDRIIKSKCRILAATNRDIEAAVKNGSFREDLYYRLNVLNLHIPALRERPADIPLLLHHFFSVYGAKYACPPPELTAEGLRLLQHYAWPGNVRELAAFAERALVLRDTDRVRIGKKSAQALLSQDHAPLPAKRRDNSAIAEALEVCDNKKGRAASYLGMHRSTLWRKRKQAEKQS